MKTIAASALVLVLLAALGVAAHEPADFSGRWISVRPGDTPGLSKVVTHEGTTLTVIMGAEVGVENKQVFVLDGKEHKSVLQSNGEIVTLYTATWKGDVLTIVSKSTYPNGKVLDQTLVWSIDPQGQLIVDVTEILAGALKAKVHLVHKKQ